MGIFGSQLTNCPVCQAKVSDNATRCRHCGAQLQSANIIGRVTGECPICKGVVSNDADVCLHCGHDLRETSVLSFLDSDRCPHCQSIVSDKAAECPHCGHLMSEPASMFNRSHACRCCSQQVSDQATYCPNCLQDQRDDSFMISSRHCPACNKKLSKDAAYCPGCGHVFEVYATTELQNARQDRNDRSNDERDPITRLLVVIGGIAFGVWLIFQLIKFIIIPLLLLNLPLLLLLTGLYKIRYRQALYILSFSSLAFLIYELHFTLFTASFSRQVPGFVDFLFYLNILAGITAAYLLVRDLTIARTTSAFHEFSRANLVTMAALLIAGAGLSFVPRLLKNRSPQRQKITVSNPAPSPVPANAYQPPVLPLQIDTITVMPDSPAAPATNSINSADSAITVTEQNAFITVQTIETIEDIEKELARIHSSVLERKTDNALEAEIEYFTENGELVKIVSTCNYTPRRIVGEFYFKNGKLFYVYRSFVLQREDGVETVRREYRKHIVDNRVIRFTINGEEKPCTQCSFNSGSVEYRMYESFKGKRDFWPTPCFDRDSDEVE